MSLAEVEEVYRELSTSYREEYTMYNLAAVAVAQALPRLASSLTEWKPLEEPSRGVADFRR